MEPIIAERLQQRARQLAKAAIALAVIVAAQVLVLEIVLRGWQGENAVTVFIGIVVSALLCILSVIIFLRTKKRIPQ
jgi:hypothetical protein